MFDFSRASITTDSRARIGQYSLIPPIRCERTCTIPCYDRQHKFRRRESRIPHSSFTHHVRFRIRSTERVVTRRVATILTVDTDSRTTMNALNERNSVGMQYLIECAFASFCESVIVGDVIDMRLQCSLLTRSSAGKSYAVGGMNEHQDDI